ncbi:MAG: hypothetical protein K8S99_11870 [Planctomycetes bacterium]|nr:hypothetical protein [Planctomycetota bacterium]
MLGCHEFCGYYDWTFRHMRQHHGQQAVRDLWEHAIGRDSQMHYLLAGKDRGLAGLYDCWVKTGEDEHCDWTFTLDEERNVLRCDMRKCPSKGFLIENDLANDEDYCDHCAGWIKPMLAELGLTFDHEHNHAGQCWWEMHPKEGPWQPLDLDIDIRKSPRWNAGFLERWKNGQRLPILDEGGASDPTQVLHDWFKDVESILVLGRGPSSREAAALVKEYDAVVVADPTYAMKDVFADEPRAVLLGDRSLVLPRVAERFNATPAAKRPLLMHMFLPTLLREEATPFVSLGLPRPVPILPLLIREGLYKHNPGGVYPTTGTFLAMLAVALGKKVCVAGIDLYRHPSGQAYAPGVEQTHDQWLSKHSEACEVEHLRRLASYAGDRVKFVGVAAEVVAQS